MSSHRNDCTCPRCAAWRRVRGLPGADALSGAWSLAVAAPVLGSITRQRAESLAEMDLIMRRIRRDALELDRLAGLVVGSNPQEAAKSYADAAHALVLAVDSARKAGTVSRATGDHAVPEEAPTPRQVPSAIAAGAKATGFPVSGTNLHDLTVGVGLETSAPGPDAREAGRKRWDEVSRYRARKAVGLPGKRTGRKRPT